MDALAKENGIDLWKTTFIRDQIMGDFILAAIFATTLIASVDLHDIRVRVSLPTTCVTSSNLLIFLSVQSGLSVQRHRTIFYIALKLKLLTSIIVLCRKSAQGCTPHFKPIKDALEYGTI